MKKYRVSGTGVHAIKLVECASKQKKVTGVIWFDLLEDAKSQVLQNRQDMVSELMTEKQRLTKRLEITEDNIAIMSKHINLDMITDEYLTLVNRSLDELSDKISRGDIDGIF